AFYVVTVTPIGDGPMKWLGVVRQASRLPVSHSHLWPLGRSTDYVDPLDLHNVIGLT
ncbi:hypothetical protein MCOR07_010532, partial [Pyricularia oryzae]